MSSPCHVEVILSEREQIVPKPDEVEKKTKKVSKKKMARQKMMGRE